MYFETEISEDSLICLHFDLRQAVSDLAYDIWVGYDRCSFKVEDVTRREFLKLIRALKKANGSGLNIFLAFVEDHHHAEAILEQEMDAS